MSSPVKRAYSSALRSAQARATRRTIVDAAAALFIEHGYGATTVDAIAQAAGVSRKTVFTSVGGKTEALKLAIDWAVTGDDKPVPMLERPLVLAAQHEPDARRILSDFAHHVTEVGARIARLHAVVASAAGLDPDLRKLNESLHDQRLVGMTHIAALLEQRDALKPSLTVAEAADLLWLLIDPRVYYRLVIEQQWTPARFESWLAETFITQLLPPEYRPRPVARPRRSTHA